jgi:hypothetical protein
MPKHKHELKPVANKRNLAKQAAAKPKSARKPLRKS